MTSFCWDSLFDVTLTERLQITSGLYHFTADLLNHVTTIFAFAITVLNLIISCFDPTIAKYAVFEPPNLSSIDAGV
ncbi:hypothetical protein NQ314_011246 [Rhamnusium bicolor]|uniref:Uncharacterized protein n=1 Tax=Rhamnusium bicolor TaxID=1586634 RepID=A0AAV8XM31_9CUCU|nr:hypothetical protein NQ314_011246 [Rhamnusium bicolor]